MDAFQAMAAKAKTRAAARLGGERAIVLPADATAALERLEAEGRPLLDEVRIGFEAEGIPCTIRRHESGSAGPALEFFAGPRRVRLRMTGGPADIRGCSLLLVAGGDGVEAWSAASRWSAIPAERLAGDLREAVHAGAARTLHSYFAEWEERMHDYGMLF